MLAKAFGQSRRMLHPAPNGKLAESAQTDRGAAAPARPGRRTWEKPQPPGEQGLRSELTCGLALGHGLDRLPAAADRRVVHEHAAGTAGAHHAGDAVAARLDHGAALRVAAGAGDADAVFG